MHLASLARMKEYELYPDPGPLFSALCTLDLTCWIVELDMVELAKVTPETKDIFWHWRFAEVVYLFSYSKAGIGEIFEGHQGPVTGINCHMAVGPIDFSHLFVTSSFDWTVKLWTTKVRDGSGEV